MFAFVALLHLCQESRGGHLGLESVLAFLLSHCEVCLPPSHTVCCSTFMFFMAALVNNVQSRAG